MSITNYSNKYPSIWYAAGVIIFNSDFTKTIIVKTPKGNVGFPKGAKENRERIHQTAYREVREETGLKSYQYKHDNTLIGEKKGDINKGVCTIYYFIAYVDKEIENIPLSCCIPNELSFVKWMNINEAYNILCKRRKTILDNAYNYIINKYQNNTLDKNLFSINNFYSKIKKNDKLKINTKLQEKGIDDTANDNDSTNEKEGSNKIFFIMNKFY
jgi:8-oxo-dGTP pyrophosphatase MutT (NUDIX family)